MRPVVEVKVYLYLLRREVQRFQLRLHYIVQQNLGRTAT
jgi:hypothetical protein